MPNMYKISRVERPAQAVALPPVRTIQALKPSELYAGQFIISAAHKAAEIDTEKKLKKVYPLD